MLIYRAVWKDFHCLQHGELSHGLKKFVNIMHRNKYNMKILLGDFNIKVGREAIFSSTTGSECSHEICNDNGISAVNLATSRNLIVKSTMFPIITFTDLIGHFLKERHTIKSESYFTHRRRHSSVLDVRDWQ
jgi:hypothetical protein